MERYCLAEHRFSDAFRVERGMSVELGREGRGDVPIKSRQTMTPANECAPAMPEAAMDHVRHPMAIHVLGRIAYIRRTPLVSRRRGRGKGGGRTLASRVPGMEKMMYVM